MAPSNCRFSVIRVEMRLPESGREELFFRIAENGRSLVAHEQKLKGFWQPFPYDGVKAMDQLFISMGNVVGFSIQFLTNLGQLVTIIREVRPAMDLGLAESGEEFVHALQNSRSFSQN